MSDIALEAIGRKPNQFMDDSSHHVQSPDGGDERQEGDAPAAALEVDRVEIGQKSLFMKYGGSTAHMQGRGDQDQVTVRRSA